MSTILSAVAVVLAAGALVASFAIPGPVGPQGLPGANGTGGATGPRGPQGPAGNGTLMASLFGPGSALPQGGACTNVSGVATLTVPSKGNVTIAASAVITITHQTGSVDYVNIWVNNSVHGGGCAYYAGIAAVPASAPTDQYWFTVPVDDVIPVSAAGTYTFAIGAVYFAASSATSTAVVSPTNGFAVFHPV